MPASPHTSRRRAAPQWLLYTGVFMIFGSLGMLLGMLQNPPTGWLFGLSMAVFSGVIATGWTYTFSTRRWWLLVPLNVLPWLVPQRLFPWLIQFDVFAAGTSLSHDWRRGVLAILIVIGVSIGFTLIVNFIARTERAGARGRAELDLAGQIHRTLVPDIALRTPRLEILGRSLPSTEMGGDLVDVVTPDGPGGRTDVYLADVSGHGVKAGIVMGMVKSAIRTRLLGDAGAPGRPPAPLHDLLRDLNSVLETLIAPEMFATFACLRFAPPGPGEKADEVEFALAGHLPILHYRAAERRVAELPNQHLPLGLEPGESFTSATTRAAPGDTFAMFTDGLSETADANGRQLGLVGVRAAFERNATRPLAELFDAVLAAAAGAHGTTSDDRTLVLVRVVAPA